MYRVPYAKALIVVGTVWLADVVAGQSAELTRQAIDDASFSEWSEKKTSGDPNPFLIRVQVYSIGLTCLQVSSTGSWAII